MMEHRTDAAVRRIRALWSTRAESARDLVRRWTRVVAGHVERRVPQVDWLRSLLGADEAVPSPSAGNTESPGAEPAPVSVTAAVDAGTALLLRSLERVREDFGRLPDAQLARPALKSILALLATQMRPTVVGRMLLARRFLASQGVGRLLDSDAPELASTHNLASLLLILLGPLPDSRPIPRLDSGVEALLARQAASGGFTNAASSSDEHVDLETTSLACRALRVLLDRHASPDRARLESALARASRWVRELGLEDGSFTVAGSPATPASTAWAVETLLSAGLAPSDERIGRAAGWLRARIGSGRPGSRDAGHYLAGLAPAIRVLMRVGARTDIERLAQTVATALRQVLDTADVLTPPWQACAEALETLGLASALTDVRPDGLAGDGSTDASSEYEADWAFCQQSLVEVSRTFSQPIALLPERLRVATTVGYLLCRIADTVEDLPVIGPERRDPLLGTLIDVLAERAAPAAFVAALAGVEGEGPELELVRALPRVLRVFRTESRGMQASTARWVSEMARGMSLYSHRQPGDAGLTALLTLGDLERYCYFVAGTVGFMLTDLFLEEMGAAATPEVELALRSRAESFGIGLQLVNVLKDVTDDRERGWSYLPRTLCAAQYLSPEDLVDPAARPRAHRAIAPVFALARRHLDQGLAYTLAVPSRFSGIRLFCLLPLWMAAATLRLAQGNDAMFIPGKPVKISRDQVHALIEECLAHHADDAKLEERYAALWLHETAQCSAG